MPPTDTSRLRIFLFAVALGGGLLPAQGRVIIVDGTNGPGTDFTDLPRAEAGARDGDILQVRPGLYRPLSTSKGIKVLCDPKTRIEDPFSPDMPSVTVHGLGAGKQFVLRGVSLGSLFVEGTRLRIENCQGRVVIENVFARERSARRAACEVVASDDVRVHRSSLSGRHGIHATGSRITITDSSLVGIHHPLAPSGSEALALESCTAVVSRTEMRGGDATFFGHLLPPAAAVLSTDSDVTITGDRLTTITAGDGQSLQETTPVPAITGSGGQLRIHSAIPLVSNGSAPGTAANLPTSIVDAPSLSASGADLGDTLEVELFARPGSAFLIVAGLPGPLTPLPGFGLLALDADGPIVVGLSGIMPSDGKEVISIEVPRQLDQLFGVTFTWQAIDIASGTALLSNSATYTHGR